MNKLKTALLIIFLVILGLGAAFTFHRYKNKKEQYEKEMQQYEKLHKAFQRDSAKYVEHISAPENGISFNASSSGTAYQSASQGIEAHLKGLSWRGFYIDRQQPVTKTMINNFDAHFVNTIDKIEFDPDFPGNGYPDIIFDIKSAPSFYKPKTMSKFLSERINREPKPYKSYELNSCGRKKAVMDLWLVSFDMTFRIEPNFEHSKNNEFEFEGKHPITYFNDNKIRRMREYNDMRYDRMAVFLEFKPKNFFYINEQNNAKGNLLSPLNPSPKIGIGAVECIFVEKVGENGENNKATRLGVEIEKGKSLPLYPSLEELKKQYAYKNYDPEKTPGENQPVGSLVEKYNNIVDVCEDQVAIADTNFFNQPKYSVIDLKNLGSWKQEKSWFLGKTEYKADYFHVKFLVHLYVLGEWIVKDENIMQFEARPPASYTRAGLFDYLLPDFNLGMAGKIFGFILLPVILLLALSFVFPTVRKLINKILGKII